MEFFAGLKFCVVALLTLANTEAGNRSNKSNILQVFYRTALAVIEFLSVWDPLHAHMVQEIEAKFCRVIKLY